MKVTKTQARQLLHHLAAIRFTIPFMELLQCIENGTLASGTDIAGTYEDRAIVAKIIQNGKEK